MAFSEEHVVQLTSMGFPVSQVREALTITNGNIEQAVNYLLGGGGGVETTGSTFSPPPASAAPAAAHVGGGERKRAAKNEIDSNRMAAKAGGILRAPISQYSVEQGRSACTCIALTAANMFLHDPTVTPEFLERMILDGVANYRRFCQISNVEHLSAEEVLQQPLSKQLFSMKSIDGSIRQGLLSDDNHHPLGLLSLLEGIRHEFAQSQQENTTTTDDDGSSSLASSSQWMVVLMTKTPETVLLCFPPDAVSPSSYWLIDSHPRPQLGVETAYAKIHPDLNGLWMSLQAIFPAVELGPDVPEMMVMMYNSFDLYPLLLNSKT